MIFVNSFARNLSAGLKASTLHLLLVWFGFSNVLVLESSDDPTVFLLDVDVLKIFFDDMSKLRSFRFNQAILNPLTFSILGRHR